MIKPLCYFVIQSRGKFCFFDDNFNPLNELVLNGYYSFIRYDNPNLMVMGELIDYGSHHSGLELIVQTIRHHTTLLRHYFYSIHTKPIFLPKDAPAYGGGVLYLNQEEVCWHVKCRSYSLENPACHDESPELSNLIHTSGLPANRYVSVKQADYFETHFMRQLLKPNGQYPIPTAPREAANKICEVLCLSPLAPVQEKIACDPELSTVLGS